MQRLLPVFFAAALAGCNSTNGGATNGGDSATTGAAGSTTGAPAPIGTLWVGGAGSVSPSSLAKSGSLQQLDVTCNPPGSATALDGASTLDSQGNLWVSFASGPAASQLIEWKSADLASCASAKPALQASMGFPLTAMAFDAAGNLWSTFLYSPDENTQLAGIAFLAAADLASGNVANPTQFLTPGCGPINELCDPTGLAFESDGTLWVGSFYSVLGYSPQTLAGLASAGTLVPDHVLTTPQAKNFDGGGIRPFFAHYVYLDPAFDAAGNLWIGADDSEGNPIDHQIVEYSKAQLQDLDADQTPTPTAVIHESNQQRSQLLISWGALAFDAQGNLWAAASQTAPNLWRYPAASLASGSAASDISITLPGDPSTSLAFDPTPTGLPLH